MQRCPRYLNLPGAFDEIQHVAPARLRMGHQELRDRPGVARQKFPIGAAGKAVLNFPYHLAGGPLFLPPSRRPCEAHKSCYLSQLQTQLAVQQEVGGDPQAGIVTPAMLQKLKRGP